MRAALTALATANPPRYVTQQHVFEVLRSSFPLTADEQALYRRLLLEGPIRGRFVAIERDEDLCTEDPDALTARFATHARAMATQAAREALHRANVAPADVDALVVNTCTGYLCPGLSSYVAEDVKLPRSTAVFDLAGMGCGSALPNLDCAARMIAAGARGTALSIAVEVCTATFFRGPDPDLVVSNSIFGDAAAAAVLQASQPATGRRELLELLDFESSIAPQERETLCYRHEGGRLRNSLSKRVPVVGAALVAETTQRLLARHDLTAEQIRWWAVHPGGTAVLERVQEKLELAPESLHFSYEVFRGYGNMSSASVLFVLEKILRQGKPRTGDKGLLLSFGAGFTAFAALVEFR